MSERRAQTWRPRRDLGDWALAAEAAFWLALARVALRTLSFAQVAGLVSRRPARASGSFPDAMAEKIGWAVGAAAARAPWRALCFEQGLAAHAMLLRRGGDPILYYGARGGDPREPDPQRSLSAHVWVRLGQRVVVGGEAAAGHAVLATFPAATPRRTE